MPVKANAQISRAKKQSDEGAALFGVGCI